MQTYPESYKKNLSWVCRREGIRMSEVERLVETFSVLRLLELRRLMTWTIANTPPQNLEQIARRRMLQACLDLAIAVKRVI